MGKQLSVLEKEFLICRYKSGGQSNLSEFCRVNGLTEASFRKWVRQYEENGRKGLVRADRVTKEVLPEGTEPSLEAYKLEILKLRIENERLKKNYTVEVGPNGEKRYVHFERKSMK